MKDERAKLAKIIERANKAKALVESGHWEIIQEYIDISKKSVLKVMGNGVETFSGYREYVGKLSVLEALAGRPQYWIKKGEQAELKMQKYEEKGK